MYPLTLTNNPAAVQGEVEGVYQLMFPAGDPDFVRRAFAWVLDCFQGAHSDYLPVDTRYHDLEHTLQGTLCLVRLLHGRHQAGVVPIMDENSFQLSLLAILLHDTGYLKRRDDTEGTGAKYTVTHVVRSTEFAAEFLANKGFSQQDVVSVQNMISCTGVDAQLDRIPFRTELERMAGFALGTADLLGQMAADDYVEKLPILYAEFEEAARHSDEPVFVASFSSAADLIEKTPGFWDKLVLPKLQNCFQGLYRFLSRPYPDGPNEYVLRVEQNMARLRSKSMLPT